MKFETKAVHAGEAKFLFEGAVIPPVFLATPYEYPGEEATTPVRYPRLSNTPGQLIVSEKISALEGTEDGIVTGSGMAAIATTLLALVGTGEHVLAQESLYGGAYQFFLEDFQRLGRTVTFFPLEHATQLERYLKPNTKVIYVESISNPLLKIPDLPAISKFARSKGIVSIIDNTFPSPVNFNPASLDFQVVIHSATKYLNGHSDVVAGCVLGKKEWVQPVRRLLKHLGASLDPHACYLLNRGLKTLPVRVRQQNDGALLLAQALEKHPKVKRVLYPGLASHPEHLRAKELFRGFGGMLAFEYNGDGETAEKFLRRLQIPFVAPSLGGVETLVTRPAVTSHSWLSAKDREKEGIGENLIRVSIGLESPADLIEDFLLALS